MDSKKEVQHVYLVGAKSLGAYGGYADITRAIQLNHQLEYPSRIPSSRMFFFENLEKACTTACANNTNVRIHKHA